MEVQAVESILKREIRGIYCCSPAHHEEVAVEGFDREKSVDLATARIRCPLCDVNAHLASVVWYCKQQRLTKNDARRVGHVVAFPAEPDWLENPVGHPWSVAFE